MSDNVDADTGISLDFSDSGPLTQHAGSAGVGASGAPSSSDPLGEISADLGKLSDVITGAKKVQTQSTDLLGQVEGLFGFGAKPAAPVDNSGSVIAVIAVGLLVVVGLVMAYKFAKRGR